MVNIYVAKCNGALYIMAAELPFALSARTTFYVVKYRKFYGVGKVQTEIDSYIDEFTGI